MMTESTELAEDVVPKHVHRGAAVDLLRRRGRQTREHQREHQRSHRFSAEDLPSEPTHAADQQRPATQDRRGPAVAAAMVCVWNCFERQGTFCRVNVDVHKLVMLGLMQQHTTI